MTSDGSRNTSTSRRHPSIGRRVQPDDPDFTSSSHSLLNGSRQLAQQHNKQHPTRSRCKGRMAHDTPAWMKQKTSFAESSWPTSPSASCGHCGWTLWLDTVVQESVHLSTAAAKTLCILCRARVDVHHWYTGRAEHLHLDEYRHRSLRQIIGSYRPLRISNETLYHGCRCQP